MPDEGADESDPDRSIGIPPERVVDSRQCGIRNRRSRLAAGRHRGAPARRQSMPKAPPTNPPSRTRFLPTPVAVGYPRATQSLLRRSCERRSRPSLERDAGPSARDGRWLGPLANGSADPPPAANETVTARSSGCSVRRQSPCTRAVLQRGPSGPPTDRPGCSRAPLRRQPHLVPWRAAEDRTTG